MKLQVIPTAIPDVKVIVPARYGDERGFLSEVYERGAFLDAGIDVAFVQENHSYSARRGTVRGLHFQVPPRAQAKLVRVARGAILDVAVDLRPDSPTFGKHVSVVLSAENWNQLYVPVGFAHGFCTLEPDTEVIYKLSDVYAPECERGLLWNDPALGIDWPVDEATAILSPRDRTHPRLAELEEMVFA
ncbi:MAG TPA: dTDP-4-dehydrorhamnose 3,5-epimerase [Longimicrobiales bacterium]